MGASQYMNLRKQVCVRIDEPACCATFADTDTSAQVVITAWVVCLMFPFFTVLKGASDGVGTTASRAQNFLRTGRPLPRVRRGRGRGPRHEQARRRGLRDRCARAASTLQCATERVPTNVPRVRSSSITNSTPPPTTCGALARDTVRESAPDAHVTAVFKLLTGLQAEDGRRGRSSDCQDGLEPSRRSACDQSDPPPFAVHVTATTPSSPGPLAGLPTSPHTHVYKEPVEYRPSKKPRRVSSREAWLTRQTRNRG